MNPISSLGKNLAQQSKKSAVNPLLYLCISSMVVTVFSNGWLTIALFSLSCVFAVAALSAYFYFLAKNPDYLRSEEYHLKRESILMFGEKDKPLSADAKKDIIAIMQINNPDLPPPSPKKEKT